MKLLNILYTLFGLLLCTVLNAETYDSLNEKSVLTQLAKFDQAMPNRDIKVVESFLSDKVVVNLNINTPNGIQSITLDKAQYIQLTLNAWSQLTPKIPKREIIKFELDDKNKVAIVNCITTEIVENGNQKITNKSEEKLIFTLNGGRIQLIESYSNVGI